jgi:hypothetical protein
MQKAQKLLLNIGSIIVGVNAALSFMHRGEDSGPAVLLFRLGVFCLGLMLLGAGGILALINKLDRSKKSRAAQPVEVDEAELFD